MGDSGNEIRRELQRVQFLQVKSIEKVEEVFDGKEGSLYGARELCKKTGVTAHSDARAQTGSGSRSLQPRVPL